MDNVRIDYFCLVRVSSIFPISAVCFRISASFSDLRRRYSKKRTISRPGTAPIKADSTATKRLIFKKEEKALSAPISAMAHAAPSITLVSLESVVVFSLTAYAASVVCSSSCASAPARYT